MDYEHRSFLRTGDGHIDRIKLKENKLIGNSYYFFGAYSKDDHYDIAPRLAAQIKQHQLIHKLVYTGLSNAVKPFQLARVLEVAEIHGSHPTRRFKDYSGTTFPLIGLDVRNAYLSVLQAYEAKYFIGLTIVLL